MYLFKTIKLSFIFILLLTSCKPAKFQYKSYEPVLITELLETPEQYDGSKVQLKGFITGAGGVAPLLYSNEKAMLEGKVNKAIHVNMREMGQPEIYWGCGGKFISVLGTLKKASSTLTVDLILTDIIELKVIGNGQSECPNYERR
ncbi:MAG: hypothetical protein ABJI60_00050 [Kangiellaceae bacterium]